nr:hypothetical protein [Stenotrophomonas acidaminiphila]
MNGWTSSHVLDSLNPGVAWKQLTPQGGQFFRLLWIFCGDLKEPELRFEPALSTMTPFKVLWIELRNEIFRQSVREESLKEGLNNSPDVGDNSASRQG